MPTDPGRGYWERNARRYDPNVHCQQADVYALPFADGRFDAAFAELPGRRRFSAATLRRAIERAGFAVTLAGPFPIGYIEATRS